MSSTSRRPSSAAPLGPTIAIVVLIGVILGAAMRAEAGWRDDRAFDAAVDQLSRIVRPQRGDAPLALLRALRQLRDPSLEPFFRQLTRDPDPIIQTHALLGLAELHDPPRIDPAIVSQAPAEAARRTVIEAAVARDMLDVPTMREMLAWDDLEDAPRLRLLAELAEAGDDIDTATLQGLADRIGLDSPLAAVLLAARGEPAALAAYERELLKLEEANRKTRYSRLLEEIRRYKLTALTDWTASRLADDLFASGPMQREVVFTLLFLDPVRGEAAWRAALGAAPSRIELVEFGMLLLALGEDAPVTAYERLAAAGDPLSTRMAAAGRALGTGSDNAAAAMLELIAFGHVKTVGWAVGMASTLPVDQARTVYLRLMDSVEGPAEGQADRAELAMLATTKLFAIDPDVVLERLRAAEDDSLTQESIMLGLLDAIDPRVGEAAASAPTIGLGRTDSIARLLVARHQSSISDAERRDLALITRGGGRVSPALQAQAAWIYLRHTSQIDRALTAIFEPPGGE